MSATSVLRNVPAAQIPCWLLCTTFPLASHTSHKLIPEAPGPVCPYTSFSLTSTLPLAEIPVLVLSCTALPRITSWLPETPDPLIP